jgi:hypothetical protein
VVIKVFIVKDYPCIFHKSSPETMKKKKHFVPKGSKWCKTFKAYFFFISQDGRRPSCRKQHKEKSVKVAGREETRTEEERKHLMILAEEKPCNLRTLFY